MTKLKDALYRCEQIRLCEQEAVNRFHIDSIDLMSQAGTEAFFFLTRMYPQVKHIAVFCGAGNNAGDGYVLARLAHEHGLTVTVYQCKALEDLPSAARQSALLAISSGVDCQPVDDPIDSDAELIVDALLGIGLKGPVQGVIANAIHHINSSGLPVIALDVPSGLNADTGQVENFCVNATMTLTFLGLKAGMYTLDGPDYCGEIHCRYLQLDTSIAKLPHAATLLSKKSLPLPLTPRKKNSHKGDYGHVLVIGGGPGMPGAVSLAAKAALRSGAGAVTIATWPDHVQSMVSFVPEAMVWGVTTAKDLAPLIEKASVCVIGPGLGENDWANTLFMTAITSQLPMVIDASALRLLFKHPQVDDNWILTPHPGEAGILLSCSSQLVQVDRFASVEKLQQQYGGVFVLKGVGTLIQTEEKETFVCPKGNPGMASAGMGDVLSGIIGGLCAQGLSLADAAKLGVWLHAAAGDELAKTIGSRGFLASDLIHLLPQLVHSH